MSASIDENQEAHVREICEKLVANDPKLKRIEIGLIYNSITGTRLDISDEGWRIIAEAIKRNTTIEDVHIHSVSDRVFSVSAALSLAGAFQAHPKLRELHFSRGTFAEFGPIALTIYQNKQLSRLELRECSITSNMMESIRFLLNEDALETLKIRFCGRREDDQLVDFAGTLASNKSLKKLAIGFGLLFASDVLEEVAQMLEFNVNFQALFLQLHESEYTPNKISRVAEAAKGHKSLQQFTLNSLREIDQNAIRAVGNMLASASALRELDLHDCDIGHEGVLHLSSSLESQNCHLKKLNLGCNEIGDNGASALAAALCQNNTIEELDLWGNVVGDRGASALAEMLAENKKIVRMDIGDNLIGLEGAAVMAGALRTNKSLKALELNGNPIGDNGAIHILDALTVNTTLEKICLGNFGTKGLNGFMASLPRMNALKSLEFGGLSSDCLNEANSDALLEAIERNATLEHFSFSDMYATSFSTKILKQVQRIMALNHAGRRILGSPTDVPRSLWPLVLAKSSNKPDIIYFFLHENPQLFMKQSILGKRKREHSSCIVM